MARSPRIPQTPTESVSKSEHKTFPFTFDPKVGEWWMGLGNNNPYREFITNSQVARLRKHWGAQHQTIHSHVLKRVWKHQRPEGVVFVVADREGTMIDIEYGATDPLACAQWVFNELVEAKKAFEASK